jgi:hypothetical protein
MSSSHSNVISRDDDAWLAGNALLEKPLDGVRVCQTCWLRLKMAGEFMRRIETEKAASTCVVAPAEPGVPVVQLRLTFNGGRKTLQNVAPVWQKFVRALAMDRSQKLGLVDAIVREPELRTELEDAFCKILERESHVLCSDKVPTAFHRIEPRALLQAGFGNTMDDMAADLQKHGRTMMKFDQATLGDHKEDVRGERGLLASAAVKLRTRSERMNRFQVQRLVL